MLWCSGLAAQQVNFRNYSVGEGLAQSQVFAIIEDPEGYIWFGTRGGGISKFDGVSFRQLTTRDGLINDFISCFIKNKKGEIIIGTAVGISVYNGKKFQNYPLEYKSNPVPINAIAEDKNGILWLATNKGLYVFKNGEYTCVSCKHALNRDMISSVFIDGKNSVWYGDDFGLNHLDSVNRSLAAITYRRKDGFTNVLVRSIRSWGKSDLLVATYGGGLQLFSGSKASPSLLNENFESNIIHDVLYDKKGNCWIATYDAGIYRIRLSDSLITHFGVQEGLANDHVSTLYEDSWGNIWVGTSGGGVSRYSGEQFIHYTEKNGLAGNYIFSLCHQGDSVLWMGTSVKGVLRMNLRTGEIIHYNADSGFVDEKVKSIFCDNNGVIWFGSEGKGLWRKDSSGFKNFTTRDGLSSNWIKDILRDKSGKLWLATAGGGITVITNEHPFTARKISERDGLSKSRVNCLHQDQNGRIWYGTEGGGIGVISDESIKNYSLEEGLSSAIVRGMREDKNGFLWVATGGGGLSRVDIYRSAKIERFTKDNGLSSDNLYLLEIDDQNNLWAGSDNGVDHLILNENSEVTEKKHYGKSEGFQGIETCQNSVTKTRDGSLWFGTINGLTRHDPRSSERNNFAPRMRFTGINLFYQPIANTRFADHVSKWGEIDDDLQLNYDENHIGFEFIGIDQRSPVSVKYQWKLDGVDEEWSPLSLKREVTYSNLPPGDYVFMVRGINEDGVVSTEPLQYSFFIHPPFWQQWWFRLLLILFFVLIIASVIILITRRSRLRHKALREKLKVEKQMVELEQKALRLQMNPHFIFHALNSIQGLITQKDEKTARSYLAKFSRLMRSILENSREQLIPLEKEVETLQDYLLLERFTRNDSFDFEIITDDSIDASEIMIPSLLLQPFVENALIHGFSGLQRRGRIKIEFRLHGKILECMVEDNGIGRKQALENKMQKDAQHKSMALIVTQERLALLNQQSGDIKDSGAIQIEDLFDEEKQAAGTRVIIRIAVDGN